LTLPAPYRPRKAKRKPTTDAAKYFERAWNLDPLPGSDMTREYRFHPTRKWRFDVAFPSVKLAIEIDGRGYHQTIVGVRADHEKQNAAVLMGWRVMRFPACDKGQVTEWVRMVKEVLCGMEAR
jgi:very-short-patch-repair endonuclease